ncbi:hypothetical protein Ccrd_022052 [Cynara cardunculus var. scolymus]|uniref:Uncharacterized protein n=1 Tax=Cynara cardunculus var. scolymus TaxID=59895 RepID=A0A118JZ97_CYNCS|nr:hypothetical protein Ccrd_022052 [Cynara cardunculus var. scolymus]
MEEARVYLKYGILNPFLFNSSSLHPRNSISLRKDSSHTHSITYTYEEVKEMRCNLVWTPKFTFDPPRFKMCREREQTNLLVLHKEGVMKSYIVLFLLMASSYTRIHLLQTKHKEKQKPRSYNGKVLIATTSTDGKCRVFSTFIKGVDAGYVYKVSEALSSCKLHIFTETSALTLLKVGKIFWWSHNSMIYFVDEIGPSPSAQSVVLRDLPLHDIDFIQQERLLCEA